MLGVGEKADGSMSCRPARVWRSDARYDSPSTSSPRRRRLGRAPPSPAPPDVAAALQEVARRLKPGARVLTLFTGIARQEPGGYAPLWSVAPYAARRLHEECRELEGVEVEQHGNVTLALAWIYRLPADDLTEQELAAVDPYRARRCQPGNEDGAGERAAG